MLWGLNGRFHMCCCGLSLLVLFNSAENSLQAGKQHRVKQLLKPAVIGSTEQLLQPPAQVAESATGIAAISRRWSCLGPSMYVNEVQGADRST